MISVTVSLLYLVRRTSTLLPRFARFIPLTFTEFLIDLIKMPWIKRVCVRVCSYACVFVCLGVCVCVFSPISGTEGDRQSGSDSSHVGIAVGVSVAIILLLASFATLVVWRQRNPPKRKLVTVIQSSQPYFRESVRNKEYTDGEYRLGWEDVTDRVASNICDIRWQLDTKRQTKCDPFTAPRRELPPSQNIILKNP